MPPHCVTIFFIDRDSVEPVRLPDWPLRKLAMATETLSPETENIGHHSDLHDVLAPLEG